MLILASFISSLSLFLPCRHCVIASMLWNTFFICSIAVYSSGCFLFHFLLFYVSFHLPSFHFLYCFLAFRFVSICVKTFFYIYIIIYISSPTVMWYYLKLYIIYLNISISISISFFLHFFIYIKNNIEKQKHNKSLMCDWIWAHWKLHKIYKNTLKSFVEMLCLKHTKKHLRCLSVTQYLWL